MLPMFGYNTEKIIYEECMIIIHSTSVCIRNVSVLYIHNILTVCNVIVILTNIAFNTTYKILHIAHLEA